MRTFTTTLGGAPVQIVAPEPGQFDANAFSATFPRGGLYGLDVESTYMDALAQWSPDFGLRLIQFATETEAWVLTLADPAQLLAAKALLANPSVSFASHNNMDVLSVAVVLGIDITSRNVDTLDLARMAFTAKTDKRDLKDLTTRLIGPELEAADAALAAHFWELWPGRRNAKRSDVDRHGWSAVSLDEPRYLVYAGLDAVAARRLLPILVRLTGAPPALLEVETWLAGRANRIQIRGMLVDQDRLAELEAEAQEATSKAEARILELTGGVKARSPKLHDWLAEHGVDWSAWTGALTEGGKPSLAKDNVALLADFELDPAGAEVAQELAAFRGHQDLLVKTKGVRDHLAPDGRVHPVLSPNGATTTARMSSAGPNFQNFSKKDPRMRGVFLPDPGYVFVTIDFDQVELRVVAGRAREPKMIDTILAGGDLHQLTVDELAAAGIEIDRDTGKMANFLIVYGGGGKALHEQAGIPLEDAYAIVQAHRDRYEQVSAWSKYLALEKTAVRTISNRRLPVTLDKHGNPKVYANVNYDTQSGARELLVDAWLVLDLVYGRGDTVWYPIHDELVLMVREDQVDEVIRDAERAMRFEFMGVPISASAIRLVDEHGVSRWMTSKLAEKIAKAVAA
jgi:DNA polymerase-1